MVIDFTRELLKQAGDSPDQSMIGSTRAGGSLSVESTKSAMKGPITIGRLVFDRATGRFGNVPQPLAPFHFAGRLRVDNSADAEFIAFEVDTLVPTIPGGNPVAGLAVAGAGQDYLLPLYPVPVTFGAEAPDFEQSRTIRFRWRVHAPIQTREIAMRWDVAASTQPADDFSRASYPAGLDGSLSSSGHRWKVRAGAFEVVSSGGGGRLRCVIGGEPIAIASLAGQSSDGIIESQIFGIDQLRNQNAGLLFRYDAASRIGWTLLCEPAINYERYVIVPWNFGTDRWLPGDVSIPRRPADGDTLKVTLNGRRITVEVKPLEGTFHTHLDQDLADISTTAREHGVACSWLPTAENILFGHYTFTPL
jgi:hypothetical protein